MSRRRLPPSAILLVIVLIIGLAVYGYLTTPLPFGLSGVIRTPGGAAAVGGAPPGAAVPAAGVRAAAGQPLQLGALTVTVGAVTHDSDLAANGRGGPVGTFTVLTLTLQNAGSQPVVPQLASFTLLDDKGRVYAPDADATHAANLALKLRSVDTATVPPGGQLQSALAFETAADAANLVLHVTLGYGEVALPH
jgi:hypothetical protein